ncbi:hypothetical protein JCM10207_008041 [Rhodosporidiobolus poonsookiae]
MTSRSCPALGNSIRTTNSTAAGDPLSSHCVADVKEAVTFSTSDWCFHLPAADYSAVREFWETEDLALFECFPLDDEFLACIRVKKTLVQMSVSHWLEERLVTALKAAGMKRWGKDYIVCNADTHRLRRPTSEPNGEPQEFGQAGWITPACLFTHLGKAKPIDTQLYGVIEIFFRLDVYVDGPNSDGVISIKFEQAARSHEAGPWVYLPCQSISSSNTGSSLTLHPAIFSFTPLPPPVDSPHLFMEPEAVNELFQEVRGGARLTDIRERAQAGEEELAANSQH